jgi:hypothetical protein
MNETKRTLRERKFIESYIDNNGNATKAYLTINSKVNKNTAGVLGNRMLRKVKININFILNQVGLNDVYLSGKLKEGLESENLSIRVRYLDMVLKLKNKYPVEKEKQDDHKVIFLGTEEKPEDDIKNKLIAKINKIAERNKEQEANKKL